MPIKTVTIPADELAVLIQNGLQRRLIAEGMQVGGKRQLVMTLEFDLAGAVSMVRHPDGSLVITQEIRDAQVTTDPKAFMDQFDAQRGNAIKPAPE